MILKKIFSFSCAIIAVLFMSGVGYATPTLSWPSGNATLAWEHVEGNSMYNTIFRIVYASPEHLTPFYHQVWVDLNDDGLFDTANEKLLLYFEPEHSSIDWSGELFTAHTTIISTSNKTVQYKFYWTDIYGTVATGSPCVDTSYITIPTFNYEPVLSYSDYPNFAGVYAYPSVIINDGTFEFRVKYRDLGAEAPLTASIYIDVDANGVYAPTECFTLQPVSHAPIDFASGCEYYYSLPLSATSNKTYQYYFQFQDSAFTVSSNEDHVDIQYSFVPYIDFVGTGHYSTSIVYPLAGNSGDLFSYRLNYYTAGLVTQDIHALWIDFNANGKFDAGEQVQMIESDPSDTNALDGKMYYYDVYLTSDGLNISNPVMCKPYFVRAGSGVVSGNAAVTVNIALNYTQAQPLVVENNYPNPFGRNVDRMTHFCYYLAQDSDVTVQVYDLAGRKVKEFFVVSGDSGARKGFNYSLTWDGYDDTGNPVLNGVYIYIIKSGKDKGMKKLVFLR